MKTKHAKNLISDLSHQIPESNWQMFFEHAPIAILLADRENHCLDANAYICNLLGYTRDELIGSHTSDILVPLKTQLDRSIRNEVKTHSNNPEIVQLQCKNGSILNTEERMTVLPNGNRLQMFLDICKYNPIEMSSPLLTAIIESSNDAIISKDLNSNVTSWNTGAEKIFGYSIDEMMGNSIMRLIPVDRQDEENKILKKIKRGEKVEHFETVRQTKDQRLIHVSITVTPIKDKMGRIIGASKIVRDITASKLHENEIARVSRLYAALSQVNQAIVWTKSRDTLFQKTCRVLVEHGGFQMAWISCHNLDTHQFIPVAKYRESGFTQNFRLHNEGSGIEQGPSGRSFHTRCPYICNNLCDDPYALTWMAEFVKLGFRATAAFPIWMNDEICATLNICSNEADFFQDKEISLLEEAAGDISFALDNLAQDEKRLHAETIAKNEKHFSGTMIESMPGILYFYNEQGQFLRWNQNFEIVSGYSHAEIAQMHPLDFFSENEKEHLKQKIAEVFEKGQSYVEASFMTRNGHFIPYFFTGRRIIFDDMPCLVGMGIDISERTKVEQELHKIQGRLEAVIENLREGLVIADEDGDLLSWNPKSLRILGFTDLEEGRARQREFTDIFEIYTLNGTKIPPDQWPLNRVRQGETLDDFQAKVRRVGSDWERTISYTGSRINYGNDKTLAFLTLQDITQRTKEETALRGTKNELERQVAARTRDLQKALVRAEAADKIKSSFLATMSHELRTPLNSIIGFTGILLQNLAGPLNTEQTRQLGMVQSSAHHLLELINDVLDISKIEANQIEIRPVIFNLDSSVEKIIASIQPMAERKNLTLETFSSPSLGEMLSDQRRVEQILLNLLNNAIKFTEKGSVQLKIEIIPDFRLSPNTVPYPVAQFQVIDTGIGIKPEDLNTLFQPFRQLDSGLTRQHEGTGLGLAICRRLAKLLKGNISARSEWTKGSEFTVTLPLQLRL